MSKARKRTQAEADYRAAWNACGKPLPGEDPAQNDLRSRLEDVLKSGWSIEALKAFAAAQFTRRYDHVTPAAWRWAVFFAKADLYGMDTRWLNEWKARQKEQAETTIPLAQTVGMSV